MFGCPKCEYVGDSTSEVGAHLNSNHRGTSYKQNDIKEIKAKINMPDSRNRRYESNITE